MGVHTRRLEAVFRTAWAQIGRPLAYVYDPLSGWTLSSGVSYDSHDDRFEDGVGAEVNVNHASQSYLEVKYVPATRELMITMDVMQIGVLREPGLSLLLLNTTGLSAALESNWAISINSVLYRMTDWNDVQPIPEAFGTPTLYRVRVVSEVKSYSG